MKCKVCGTENPHYANYCQECGAKQTSLDLPSLRVKNNIDHQNGDLFQKVQFKVVKRVAETHNLTPDETNFLIDEIQKSRESSKVKVTKNYNQKAVDAIREWSYNGKDSALNAIDDSIRESLVNSYKMGYGYAKAANQLRKITNKLSNSDLMTIAHTVIHSARGQANHLQMIGLGAGYKKWITARDDLVRGNDPKDEADHVIMDGEIAKIDEPYSNGLMYPGDMNGPIEEWINCRCDFRPFNVPLGKKAPSDGPFHEEDLVDIH